MAKAQQRRIPDGYIAVPIHADPAGGGAGLRIAAVFRKEPDPIHGHFVPVGAQTDAAVILGGLIDAAGAVHQWLDIAIQDADRVAKSLVAARNVLNNRLLDERWVAQCRAEHEPPHGPILWSKWEHDHPLPTLVDPKTGVAINPREKASGYFWRLCTDDKPLTQVGLAPYSSTLHRYLWLAEGGAESNFVPLTTDAPRNERCITPQQAIEGFDRLVPLNIGGGLQKVRRYLSVRYEDFSDVLGGMPWNGVRHGRSTMGLDHDLETLHQMAGEQDMFSDGWLFQDQHGKWGRLIETLHLKLRSYADIVDSVYETIRHTKTPLLNVEGESFRVKLGKFGCGMPYLWTATTELRTPGCAFGLPIKATDREYFLRTDSESSSMYRPASASAPIQGRGMLRIREVASEGHDATVLTATLTTQHRIEHARNDLLWLRMELRKGHFDLYANLEAEHSLASGEWRLRTIPMTLTPEIRAALKEAAGVPIDNVMFELLPLLSTPHDLYALGVVGARSFLVDADNSLPVAIDELMSLARQVAVEYDEATPLGERIDAIFQRDPRWLTSIGPQRLTRQQITPQEALDLIPADLWYDTLGMLISMFPGVGKDSICKDFADAPIGGVHRIFEPVRVHLDRLLRRTRSLIIIDWRYNREISGVLRQYETGLRGEKAAGSAAARV